MQQGLCYRSLGSGTCTLPLVQRITKQICCCSRVGKAWGSKCEQCPLPGTGNHTLSPAQAIKILPKSVTTSPAWESRKAQSTFCIPDLGLSGQSQMSCPFKGRKGGRLVYYRNDMAQFIFCWVF